MRPRSGLCRRASAQLDELAHRLVVLGAGIAVAEVAAQIEPQALGQPRRLGDRLRVLGEARRHRRRRGEHVAEVAAPLRLRGIERRVQAHRHERVLKRRARARVGVDVAGRHARHPEPSRRAARGAGCGRGRRAGTAAGARPAGGRRRTRRAAAAGVGSSWTPRSAQPLRQTSPSAWSRIASSGTCGCDGGPGFSRVCACARVKIRQRLDQPRASSTSSVRWRPSSRSTSAPWIGAQPERPGGDRELHRARDRVVVGQRERVVARARAPPRRARRAARPRRGTRRRNGSGARRTSPNICSHSRTGRFDPDPQRALDKLLVTAKFMSS